MAQNIEHTLVAGSAIALRLWRDEEPGQAKAETTRPYETVGYVLAGRAELTVDGKAQMLSPGDSYLVPNGARHTYRILERFSAVEATSPPAQH